MPNLCLYQIQRTEINHGQGYRFELRNTILGCIVLTAFGSSPIAPKWLREYQARLNTRSVLDHGRIITPNNEVRR